MFSFGGFAPPQAQISLSPGCAPIDARTTYHARSIGGRRYFERDTGRTIRRVLEDPFHAARSVFRGDVGKVVQPFRLVAARQCDGGMCR